MSDGEKEKVASRAEAARKALLAAIPSPDNYPDAKPDLVAGLQKRDFKYATAISPQLLEELGGAILPTKIVTLTFQDAKALYDEGMYAEFESRNKTVQDIIDRVDKAISDIKKQEEYKDNGSVDTTGFFVKLSFMSPKDVVLRVQNKKTRDAMTQKVDELWYNSSIWDQAFVLSASHPTSKQIFLDSLYSSLRVQNGKEAIAAICQSRRCFEELSDALIDENYFHTNIILRPWVKLRPGFEFRIYVSNGMITAASQYESVYYEEVWKERERLREKIGEFVKGEVIPKLCPRLPSVVIDVVMATNGQVYVCELNPFAASSSACLFSWSDDKHQLLAGDEEWRFVSPGDVDKKATEVPQSWAEVIDGRIEHHRTATFFFPVAVLCVALFNWTYYFYLRERVWKFVLG
uniref:Cell division cycle protein 123 n=1 Tax=Paramoeba aestuarina TaxID=180227 RepID=A0A7S4P835_9EUKA|mmetsp:Transcript_37852/g.59832  ORF Transcript_37852/g.59832 Transcript_37852/m.59832 type:complete len:405 (+) Transcript_37852:67-1281(+)